VAGGRRPYADYKLRAVPTSTAMAEIVCIRAGGHLASIDLASIDLASIDRHRQRLD
jgi:hypothetical protein